jgi:hypothetical protein
MDSQLLEFVRQRAEKTASNRKGKIMQREEIAIVRENRTAICWAEVMRKFYHLVMVNKS